jgi:hypothetical protein
MLPYLPLGASTGQQTHHISKQIKEAYRTRKAFV